MTNTSLILRLTRRLKSSGLKRLRKVGGKIAKIDADEDITLVDIKTQVDLGAKLKGRKDDDNAASKDVNVAEPNVFDDEEVIMNMAQTLTKIGMTYDKKIVAKETLLQESFKKLKAVEVSVSESTQETPTNDPKEMSKEDVQNMLEIIPVSEFKIEALQVKYPLIDWEIHSEGSRSLLELSFPSHT
uniref:Uncharacterized protein n=1 Tax=Tanacetum cinerariifolium TaxID=118510 RepID=A0A699J3F6_TANCI|nr:hypothetical protein [Tanacetum cinerariifolium]